MKNKILSLSVALVCMLFMNCATPLKIVKPYKHKKDQPLEKIGLFPVMIGKLNKPIFPLIDASIFNAKPNKISSEIMTMQGAKVLDIRNVASETLKKYFRAEIVTTDALISHDFYQELSAKYHREKGLATADEHFPHVILAKHDVSPFRFENGNVLGFFKNPEKAKYEISTMCEKFDFDALAISYSFLNIYNILPFGYSAGINLHTSLYIFDRNGDLIGEAAAYSKGFQIKGKDVAEYELVLDDFQTIFDPLVQKLISGRK